MLLVHPRLVPFGTETHKRSKCHTFWGQILTETPLGLDISMWTFRENLKELNDLNRKSQIHSSKYLDISNVSNAISYS